MKTKDTNLNTTTRPTWCPGCFNFQILAGFKNYVASELKKKNVTKDDFAICSGIACQAKIFDYVNLNGLNTLHGRELPSALGLKLGNPKLNVFAFGGDGGTYSEGMSHLIHAARHNANITFTVHNNQVFALTVGQPTSVTEKGYSDKTTPEGVVSEPLNPIKLMLNANCSFVARVFADVKQVEWVYKEAAKHKGFKFIEIIQPCIIFHPNKGYKEHTYMLEDKKHDSSDFNKAMKRASEWNYDGIKDDTKIPLGIFYKKKRQCMEDQHWQLKDSAKKK